MVIIDKRPVDEIIAFLQEMRYDKIVMYYKGTDREDKNEDNC